MNIVLMHFHLTKFVIIISFIILGPKDWAGKITLKHIYEIAKIKAQDPLYDCIPLKEVCQKIIDAARRCGVQTVRELTVEEYSQFLEERKVIVAQQQAEIEEKRKAKILRQTAKS